MQPLFRVDAKRLKTAYRDFVTSMAKPAIYIVAPDPNFIKVAERHLNTEFGDRLCILIADSGAGAIVLDNRTPT